MPIANIAIIFEYLDFWNITIKSEWRDDIFNDTEGIYSSENARGCSCACVQQPGSGEENDDSKGRRG